MSQPPLVREFTVAIFVVHQQRVLLHWHRKLRRWLPPGGHIEPGELPDDAAIRETAEECGLDILLVDSPAATPARPEHDHAGEPRRLVRPLGIQLEDIGPGHQHIDLIYAARIRPDSPAQPAAADGDPDSRPAWYALDDLPGIGVFGEVADWATMALAVVST